jgi:hypothetical protein
MSTIKYVSRFAQTLSTRVTKDFQQFLTQHDKSSKVTLPLGLYHVVNNIPFVPVTTSLRQHILKRGHVLKYK